MTAAKFKENIWAVGKRKTSIARVYMRKGKGNIIVNGKAYEQYFPHGFYCWKVQQPLSITNTSKKFDIKINVLGGGVNSQAEAARHGIARAIVKIDNNYKSALKELGLLSRDARVVERKKFGHKKARKSFQFSKR